MYGDDVNGAELSRKWTLHSGALTMGLTRKSVGCATLLCMYGPGSAGRGAGRRSYGSYRVVAKEAIAESCLNCHHGLLMGRN